MIPVFSEARSLASKQQEIQLPRATFRRNEGVFPQIRADPGRALTVKATLLCPAMAASRHVTINHADVYITRYVVAKKRLFQKIAFLKESSDSAGRLELKGHVVLQDARTGKVSYGCDLVTSTKFRLFELGKVEQGKFWIPKDKG